MRPRGTTQEDYLLRLIRQAGEALRRLRRRLTGSGDAPEIVRMDAAAAIDALLGVQSPMLAVLDPVSACRIAAHPDVVALWAALLDVEAGALHAMGDAPTAARREARATALRDAAREIWDESTADTQEQDGP